MKKNTSIKVFRCLRVNGAMKMVYATDAQEAETSFRQMLNISKSEPVTVGRYFGPVR